MGQAALNEWRKEERPSGPAITRSRPPLPGSPLCPGEEEQSRKGDDPPSAQPGFPPSAAFGEKLGPKTSSRSCIQSADTAGPSSAHSSPRAQGPRPHPTGSCLSCPKKRCVRRQGACPCPRTRPPLLKHPVCLLPPTLHPGRPQNLSMGVSVQRACSGGRWEKGHPRTRPQGGRDSSESLSPTVPLGPEPQLGGLHFPLGNGGSGERTPRLASPRQG